VRTPAAVFEIALALGAIILAPGANAQTREERRTEIEKCRTIDEPGSYRLTNNIVGSGFGAACLLITASFVTIDLAGFSISNGEGAIGLSPSSHLQGIAVRNGSIFGVTNAVDLGSASGSIVEGLRIAAELGVGISASGIVRNNSVSGATAAISATGIITGNYASGRIFGMQVGQGSTVIGNTSSAAVYGISVDCPSNVIDNTAVNSQSGIVLNGDGCHSEDNIS
jgi:hypothetical protein